MPLLSPELLRQHHCYTPIVPADILDRFHAKEPFDTRFSSCARLLQSIWRDRRGFPIGEIIPKEGPRRRSGIRLTPAMAQRGFNFLTRDIAKLVRQEAAYREYGAMFDEERLWGNLLSSQPLVLASAAASAFDARRYRIQGLTNQQHTARRRSLKTHRFSA